MPPMTPTLPQARVLAVHENYHQSSFIFHMYKVRAIVCVACAYMYSTPREHWPSRCRHAGMIVCTCGGLSETFRTFPREKTHVIRTACRTCARVRILALFNAKRNANVCFGNFHLLPRPLCCVSRRPWPKCDKRHAKCNKLA